MLGKLLKHEFRATGRAMLLLYGAVVVLTVLANLSIRFMDVTGSAFLQLLFTLVIVVFTIGVIAAAAVTVGIMVSLFRRSLLGDQGYLMHTLPVSVHTHLWSKLLVALVWFAATALLILVAVLLTVFIQSGTGLGEIFSGIPAFWEELRRELGVQSGDMALYGLELFAYAIVAALRICLHFYAAMSLGHMFSRRKGLMSVVFFLGISLVFHLAGTGLFGGFYDSIREVSRYSEFLLTVTLGTLAWSLVRCALLYIAAALGLKKGLNLA